MSVLLLTDFPSAVSPTAVPAPAGQSSGDALAAGATLFAIRPEDALSWHHATQLVAGMAQRAGYRIRVLPGQGWHVWATDGDYGDLVIQAGDWS